jgi:exosortase/archaeosortase family protein
MSEQNMWVTAYFRRYSTYLKIFLIFLSVAIPLAVLYSLYPASFDKTFNGRSYYLFFVWLVVLEFALDWDKYKSETSKMDIKRIVAFCLALSLPTCYVVVANFFGFNAVIIDVSASYGVLPECLVNMPLSIEYIAFAVLFAVVILFAYKLKGLMDFSLSVALLGVVGAIHLINAVFPYGGFTPFQILVPATASLSADFLNLMGYSATLWERPESLMPTLFVRDVETGKSWAAQIAWPCAGVESLLLYTIIMLLFLKKSNFPRLHKIIYFAVGAVVTYFINILRIVTIFLIGLNGGDVWTFHDYYGQLYSAVWIMFYPLIIIGSQVLWSRYKDVIVNFIVND